MTENNKTSSENQKGIDWKQGFAIAIGVPLLILPSIGYFTSYLWAFSIVVWMLSVFQGFMQNIAYGEMAAMFTEAAGLPGFAQSIFKSEKKSGKYDKGKFLGGFSAWSYWFAWNPILAIFSILIGDYLHDLLPVFSSMSEFKLSFLVGVVTISFLILVNYRGLSGGAVLGYVLAVLSMAPILVISLAPFMNGHFDISNISGSWMPRDWQWDSSHILMILGIFAMAQWSACAWETAAIYGPEYRNPKKDLPKALFACGTACLIIFGLIQTSCIGTIGVENIISNSVSPMVTLASISFGQIGSYVAVVMLITAIILIMQTAILGASRAMHSMAVEGNLPGFFGKMNKHGTPVNAMVCIFLFNLVLISLRTPTAIIAASSIGYVFANGISLFAYVKAKRSPRFAKLDRPFKAPSGWENIALFFGIINIPLYLVGIVYLNSLEVGITSTLVGFVVLALYVPLWIYSQKQGKASGDNEVSDYSEKNAV